MESSGSYAEVEPSVSPPNKDIVVLYKIEFRVYGVVDTVVIAGHSGHGEVVKCCNLVGKSFGMDPGVSRAPGLTRIHVTACRQMHRKPALI